MARYKWDQMTPLYRRLPLKRATFQLCADVDPERYKVLARREQLPFRDNPTKNDFKLSHAFRLRLALDLMGGESKDRAQLQGLNPDYASAIVFNVALLGRPLADDVDLASIAQGNLWAGLAVFDFQPQGDGSESEGYKWSKWFTGELKDLPAFVEEAKSEENAPGIVEPVRVFLADASACARGVLRRAEDLGIEA